ncbi:OLC1v1012101C1 [Oldenlandia corymbosa var. corymbosa]|uniref:OLC1v1012101C1 n=1 Tax=Oldenlandia corymbosa var. corymbosa TaxID=529605 RepID=A0AAV1DVR4_OLDCO|nr:OLC1v1012101C1 [Oldenlandia corymbosa var. corymbosa]
MDMRWFDSSLNSDTDFEEELYDALVYDRKDVFVCLLNDLTREEFDILNPLDWILCNDSVHCLEAVLNGETAGLFEIDVNSGPILHSAARYGATKITEFCLPPNEVQVNLGIDVDDDGLKGLLPLNLALRRLWFEIEGWRDRQSKESSEWISEPSPEEPERRLCKKDAEAVRLLASKTVEIEQELLKYLKEGKLLELTALLMFARDRVTPCLEGGSKTRDFVLQEIAALKIFIFRSTCDFDKGKLVFEAQKKKMEMEAVLLLLEIFDRVGDKIEAYLHCSEGDSEPDDVREVCWILKEAGFDAEFEILDEKNDSYSSGYHLSPWEDSYHSASCKAIGRRGFGTSAMAKKVGSRSDFSSQSFHHKHHHFVRASGDLESTTMDRMKGILSKLQLKKEYQDFGKSGRMSRASYLRECVLSAESRRRIVWITNKLGRV